MTTPKRSPHDGSSPKDVPGASPGAITRASHSLQPKDPSTMPEHLRASRDRIYESMMRGGGEPFGPPFAAGLSSLTQWVVRKIKQRGFFAFETLERPDASSDEARSTANKFTRYGAAPFRGEHRRKRKP